MFHFQPVLKTNDAVAAHLRMVISSLLVLSLHWRFIFLRPCWTCWSSYLQIFTQIDKRCVLHFVKNT